MQWMTVREVMRTPWTVMASALSPLHSAFIVSSMSCWWMTRSLGVAPFGNLSGGASLRVI